MILAACVLCEVTEVYRMGGAQAIAALAYGTESVRAGGRDRRPRQPVRAGGQAPGGGARSASTASRAPASSWWSRAGRRPGAGRARPAGAGGARGGQPALVPVARRRPSRRSRAAVERLAPGRPSVRDAELQLIDTDSVRRGRAARRRDRARAPRARGRGRRGAGRSACAARLRVRRRAAPARRSATTWPGPTTCCPQGARRASSRRCPRPPSGAGWRAYPCPARRRPASRPPAPHWPAPRAFPSTPSRWSAGREQKLRHPPHHERDRRRAQARPRRRRRRAARDTGVGFFDHLLDARGPPRRDRPRRARRGRPRDGRAPHRGGHGPRARAGARRGARRPRRASAASARR